MKLSVLNREARHQYLCQRTSCKSTGTLAVRHEYRRSGTHKGSNRGRDPLWGGSKVPGKAILP